MVVHRTLKEQDLHPYHIRKVQALEQADFPRRVIYDGWLLQQCRERPNFLNGILFRDEAGFTCEIVGARTKQNKKSTTMEHYQKSVLLRTFTCFNN